MAELENILPTPEEVNAIAIGLIKEGGYTFDAKELIRLGAEATLHNVVEWGNEECKEHHPPTGIIYMVTSRFECEECLQALRRLSRGRAGREAGIPGLSTHSS